MAIGRLGLRDLAFTGAWRRYQLLALDAFDADVRAGRHRTHIVAPPGSGKTLLGVEIVRRLGSHALVLAPNSAVQAQWVSAVRMFVPDAQTAREVAAPDPDAPIACLTYQTLCQLEDPGALMGEVAAVRWARERSAATGEDPEQLRVASLSWTGEAARRRAVELSRITAAIKREVARGEHVDVGLADLLSPTVRDRIEALRLSGVRTVVLDECHHLASMWGYVVREVVDALGDVQLVGLTATPPDELTTSESELYSALLGPVDFQVPTPAVVRDGYLAPYQELAWLVQPTDAERRWLREHGTRFKELVVRLHEPGDEGPLSFPRWIMTRLRDRIRPDGAGEVGWAAFARSRPTFARAGVRYLSSAGLPLPRGAPRGEGYRQPPDTDDWVELLQDYALRCLAAHPGPDAAQRYAEIGTALRDLGFLLTRRGIRRGASDVDQVLTSSASKLLGLVEVVAAEHDARGDGLRGLVLCDAEVRTTAATSELAGVLDPTAGTAPGAVMALSSDQRTAPLRAMLVSGRGVRCHPDHAQPLLDALAATAPDLDGWTVHTDGALARLSASGPAWQPRRWVRLATEVFTRGATKVLVGTRAMLGEGWDAPSVNCLVDLTSATTGVAVRQMRGRSLRLDPAVPDKMSSNWDVVCVAPELERGSADYHRFVRKHLHLHAPCEDGTIEAGPSHVHPSLNPFRPPDPPEVDPVNRAMRTRAADHAAARERWAIGTPYEGVDLVVVVVHTRDGLPPRRAGTVEPPRYPVSNTGPASVAASAALAGVVGLAAGSPLALGAAGLVPAAGWKALRLRRARSMLPAQAPLDLVARAVADAFVEVGDMRPGTPASLALEPRPSGYLRVLLRDASREESEMFARALDEALGPVDAHRYVISRLAVPARRGTAAMLVRSLTRQGAFDEVWHAVPSDFARHRNRAEPFARAWRRWLGPARLVFTQRTEEGRRVLSEAQAQSFDLDLQFRTVWR